MKTFSFFFSFSWQCHRKKIFPSKLILFLYKFRGSVQRDSISERYQSMSCECSLATLPDPWLLDWLKTGRNVICTFKPTPAHVCKSFTLWSLLLMLSHVWCCNPTDCSQPGSSVHGIFQARTLEWVAISFSRGSSWSKVRTWVFCITGSLLYCRWILHQPNHREAQCFMLTNHICDPWGCDVAD